MKKLGWLLIFAYLAGCSNSKELSPAEAEIIGKWQLAEFCVSPGDSSCSMQTATPATTQVLDFRKDGSFIEKIPQPGQFQTPIRSSGEYRLEAPDRIYFQFDSVNNLEPEKPWAWGYTITGNLLTIQPSVCNEGCIYIYKKI